MNNKIIVNTALAAIIAMTFQATSSQAQNNVSEKNHPGMEKCYSIAKKGMNECSTAKHSCAGYATIDGDSEEYIYVPKGTCKKIVGGVLKSKKAKTE